MIQKAWTNDERQSATALARLINLNMKEYDDVSSQLDTLWDTIEWQQRTDNARKHYALLRDKQRDLLETRRALSQQLPRQSLDFEKLPKNTIIYQNTILGTSTPYLFERMQSTKYNHRPLFKHKDSTMGINNWEKLNFSLLPLFDRIEYDVEEGVV